MSVVAWTQKAEICQVSLNSSCEVRKAGTSKKFTNTPWQYIIHGPGAEAKDSKVARQRDPEILVLYGASPGPSRAQAGSQKIPKIKILKTKIRVAQNVGKVWISRKKSSWPHLGPSGAIFCMGRKKSEKLYFVSLIFAILPVWGLCCYPPELGQ